MELLARYRIGYVYSMKGHTIVEKVLPLGIEPVADTDIEVGRDEDSGEIIVRFVMIIMGKKIDTQLFPEDVSIGFTDGGIIVWREIDRTSEDIFLSESQFEGDESSFEYEREAITFFEKFVAGKKDPSLM